MGFRGHCLIICVAWLLGGMPQAMGSRSQTPASVPTALDLTPLDYSRVKKPNPQPIDLIELLEPLAHAPNPAARTLQQLGLAYAQDGNPEKAVTYLQEAVKLDPRNGAAWCDLGANLFYLGRGDEALVALDHVIKLDPTNELGWNGRAFVLQSLNRTDEAGAAVAEGLKYAPNSARLWNTLAVVQMRDSHFAEGMKSLKRSLEIDDMYPIAWGNLVIAQVEMKQYDEAIASGKKALAINPNLWEAWGNLAEAYAYKGDLQNFTMAAHRSLELHFNQPALWTNMAVQDYVHGNWAAAVEEFGNAVDKLGRKNVYDYGEYAESAGHIGHFEDAHRLLEEAEKLQEIKPAEPNAHRGGLWVNMGNVAIGENQLLKAEECFLKALNETPKNPFAMLGLGLAKGIQGRPEEAIEWLEKVAVLKPEISRTWTLLGLNYEGMKKRKEAAEAFRKGVELVPQDSICWLGLARNTDDLGEIENAVDKAVALDPKNIPAHRALPRIKAKLRKYAEAETACRALLALDASSAEDWEFLAATLLAEHKNDEAIKATLKALEVEPSLSAEMQARYWSTIGIAHYDKAYSGVAGEYELAANAFQKSVQLDPAQADTWYRLSVAAEKAGNTVLMQSAGVKYRELSSGGPVPGMIAPPVVNGVGAEPVDVPPTLMPQASLLDRQVAIGESLVNSNRNDEALALAEKLTNDYPKESKAWLMLSRVQRALKEPD